MRHDLKISTVWSWHDGLACTRVRRKLISYYVYHILVTRKQELSPTSYGEPLWKAELVCSPLLPHPVLLLLSPLSSPGSCSSPSPQAAQSVQQVPGLGTNSLKTELLPNLTLEDGFYPINWSASKYDFWQRGRGVSQIHIFCDKGGRGGKPISDFWLTRGEGGYGPPHFWLT